MRRALFVVAIAAVAACKKDPAPAADAGAAASSSSAAAASAAPADAGAKPTSWTVTYTAVPGTLYIPAEKDWAHTKFKNDETKFLGEGKLSLTVDPSGKVTGTSEGGALGDAIVDGFSDGATLTGTVRRKDPSDDGLTGAFSAKIAGDALEGEMKLAESSASVVREAKLSGKKAR